MKRLLSLVLVTAALSLPAFANTMNDDMSTSTTTTESVKKAPATDGMQRMEERKVETTKSKDSSMRDLNEPSSTETSVKKKTEKSSY